ncbi:hypothetical protein [Congregibacter sp.]|uniref:hypothetical protein n=1 Tax=Congregibacter sp. TaxID=2744308 RepID=UPI003859348A
MNVKVQRNTSSPSLLPSIGRSIVCAFAAIVLALITPTAIAQIPTVSLQGLPATPLIGEEFCVDASFTNADSTTGYGPYLIAVVDSQIRQLSVDFVDIPPQLTQIGTFDATGMLTDPISGIPLTGNPGGSAWIARYPVGSVDQGQPALVMTVCAVVEAGADIGVAKPVEVIPGFEFGDTTVGTNGAITGTPSNSTVTPELARITKANSAPEGERPPGPSHAFVYTWNVDISEGVAIENIVLSDVLPAQIQWTGDPISIASPFGVGCSITGDPNLAPITGGTVTAECTAVLGTAGTADLTVSVPVYISDVLDETLPDSETIINTVTFDYDYQGTGFNDTANSTVTAEHATLQKSVSGTGLPGGVLTYVMNFRLTDYPDAPPGAGANAFLIDDVIADGLNFDGTVALIIDGATVPITATAIPGPGPGQTSLTWDIAAATGGQLDNGAQGSLTYETTILDTYANGDPVLAADGFDNSATLTYGLTEGGSGANDSTIEAAVQPNVPDKTIFSPNPVPPVLEPGDEVVFELSLSIPAGNTDNVTFVDFLPRPVFTVADFVEANDLSILPPFASLNPTVTTQASNNSIRMEFGNVATTIATTLRVRLTARIVGTPFADSLFLTNLLETNYDTTDGRTITDLQAVGGTIGAPSLTITKGVIATDNSDAIIVPAPPADPSTETAESDVNGVDAFDEITYLLTVENVGTTPAYNVTFDEPVVSLLACTEPTLGDVVDGNGNVLPFTGSLTTGIVLDDPLAANDGMEGAPYGTDTALATVRCTLDNAVEPLQTVTNEAGVTWTSVPDPSAPFTRVTDTAEAVIANPLVTKTITDISPGYSSQNLRAHIGELVTYDLVITVPEGTSTSVRVEDRLPNGMAFADVVSIVPSSADVTTSLGNFNNVLANAGFNSLGSGETAPDRRLVFGPANNASGFGTITNANSDNTVDETITITYRAKVLNASVNTSGQRRRNRARWLWQTSGESRRNVQGRADPIRIVESSLQLAKTFTPDTGDNATPPLVTLTLNHASGTTADAFDVSLSDVLPNDMRVDGPIDDSLCPATPDNITITSLAASDQVEATWGRFPQGAVCTLRFQTEFIINPIAGSQLENCAESLWESLLDTDQPVLPTTPNNTLGVERTGNDADPGQQNNYRLQSCDIFTVFGVGLTKNVTTTDQSHTDNIPGTPADAESLTIGETVTFQVVATIPDVNIPNLTITDLLPITDNVLELVSARTISVGGDLTPTIPDPTAAIDDRDGDGVNDRAVLNYGPVTQAADGTTNFRDRIRIEVVAKVKDVLVNQNNDSTSNGAIARFLPSITSSDSAALEIVEPLLSISKTANTGQAEAGDLVTYTLRVEHSPASRIDAKDLALSDVIPTDLSVVPADVRLGAVCSALPDTGPTLAAGEITATWSTFPLGGVCEIEFDASVNVTAVTGQTIINTAEVIWTTLDTQGDPDDRSYDLTDQWTLNISAPGIAKEITAIDIGDFVLGASSQDLTIGSTVTFTIDADFPDGTTEQAFVTDSMPNTDVAFEITRTEVIAIGSDLSISSGLLVGDAALDCSPGAPQTCAEWLLGNVVNTPDNRPEPDTDDRVTFEIDAIVLDNALNSGAPGEDKNLQNRAQLRSNSINVVAATSFDLIEPQLQISKLTENGTLPAIVVAAEQKRFVLEINHAAISTATARSITVTDVLNSDMLWVNDSTVVSDCPGFAIVNSPAPLTNGSLEFSVDSLSVAESFCEIGYDVQAIGAGFPVPSEFPNVATIAWESAPTSPESRAGGDSDRNFLVSLSTASVSKVVSGTSVPDTGSAQANPLLEDLTIGEQVRYEIVTAFSEGQQTGVVLTDTLQDDDPSGPILELIGGNVISIGDNITTSLPGTPVVAGNVITIDYGTVDNVADMILNEKDTIVYELIARVVDVPNNVAGITLTNTAELNFVGAGLPETSSVDIDVVEPVLAATKDFTDLTEGIATIEITVTNSGTSSAYELTVTDAFDETFWIPGSLTPITLPPGFTLTEASAAGTTTVTLETEGNPAKPEEVLAPGETLSITFSMELVNGGIVGVSQIDNTADVEATSLPGVDPAERTYTTTATDSLFFPDLVLEKTWIGPNNPAEPGDTITYTLTLDNNGLAAATTLVITDTPDAIGEFQAGSVSASGIGVVDTGNTPGDTSISVSYTTLAATATATITYDVLLPLPYPDGQTSPEELSNQANADSKEQQGIISDDPTTGTADDPTVVPVIADPVMNVTKDDQVVLTAPGAVIEYLIAYSNLGNQDATGVVITETVPANTVYTAASSAAGWSCADGSGPGTTCEFTVGNLSDTPGNVVFAVLVDTPLPPAVTQIDNLVSITDDGDEFDPGAPVVPSTDTDTEQTPIGGASPQLQITKDDGGIGVTPGQRYSYLIDYANIGNQGATGVVVSETVPDDVAFSAVASLPSVWSCPDGSPPGTVCSITIPLLLASVSDQARFGLDVNFPAEAGRELIINTVDIEDDGANSVLPATDTDTDDTPLIAVPEIYVSKQTDAGIVREGDSIIYTAMYGNQGNQNATGVIVREAVPLGSTFNASNSAPTPWSCADGAPGGTICEYQAGAVNVGFMETLMFAIDVVSTPDNRQIINIIEANDDFSNGLDPVPENNIARVINMFPALSVDTMSRSALIVMALLLLGMARRHQRRER